MADKKTRRNINLRYILAFICFIVGLALIFSPQITSFIAKQSQNEVLHNLNKDKIRENEKSKGDFAQVTKSRIKNNAKAVGAIAIPSVHMYLPILKGLSNDSLSTGGGTMRPDQKMGHGNYPLAGHYMTANGSLFSPLESVKKGKLIYLTDLKKVYIYKIYMKKKVPPTAVWLVDDTPKNIVTLITCADWGANRWAIRGSLIRTVKATDEKLRIFKLRQ
ncbi:MAG: class A sortase [Lactobacillus iners]|nr:class A sortase [Lactobacillus iners]